MALVNNPLFARYFARFGGRNEERGNREHRQEMLAGLSGQVMEVGPGNGLNFPHYPRSVREVVAVEPEPYLRSRAVEAAADAPVPIRVADGTADELPAADGSVDAVVVSGLLCSVADVPAALAEFHRVLRPGGQLRFYEHVRSRDVLFAGFQQAADLVLAAPHGRVPRPSSDPGGHRAGLRYRDVPWFPVPAGRVFLAGGAAHPRHSPQGGVATFLVTSGRGAVHGAMDHQQADWLAARFEEQRLMLGPGGPARVLPES